MSRHIVNWVKCLLFVPLIASCGGGKEDAPVEIVYWTGWSGHELEVQQHLIKEFNDTHPKVHVRLVTQFDKSGYEKVRIAFAGNATPDVMSTVWAEELASYAIRGVLEPLDSYMAHSGRDLHREFVPGIANTATVQGKVYGLAVTTSCEFIVFNKAVFRDAGLDPSHPPLTIAELDHAAEKCTVRKPSGEFVRYGFRPQAFRTWAYVFGGRWFDPVAKKITANDPHNVAALQWMASYNKRYDLKRIQAFQSSFGSDSTNNGPFYQGHIATWTTGEWSQEFLRRYAPTLDYGWFALPPSSDGRTLASCPNGSMFVIPKASKHKAEAWEFLNWITSKHAVEYFSTNIGNVPALISAGEAPFFQRQPMMKFAINLSRQHTAFPPPAISMWTTYNREIQRAEEAAMLGNQDPKTLMDDLQRRMEREYARSCEDLGQ